jgi:predicted component of type VI protein secretion system
MATPVTLKFIIYGTHHIDVLDKAECAVQEYFSDNEEIDSDLLKNIKYEIIVTNSEKNSELPYKAEVIARFKDE